MVVAAASTRERIKQVASELATRRAERSLAEFAQQAWPIIEPETPLKWNWHCDAICQHIEAVDDGRIKNLLVNIPPGCMKSLLLVFRNARAWTSKPWLRFLHTTYGDTLATRDNLKVRQIVESEWYQSRWGRTVKLAADQNQKTRFNTSKRGYRIGVPINGNFIGEHPHHKEVDDPHNVKKALSAEERKTTISNFDQGLSSRGVALKASTIVMMQRLNQADLSGYLLENQPQRWVHMCLPMRYEPPTPNEHGELVPRMAVTPLGFQDPRTERGELLWPDLFPEDAVADLEVALGPYGTAGQLQQSPSPEKGGVFERAWFSKIVDAPPSILDIAWIGRGWDAAATEGGGDWTVGVLMAITFDGRIWILDVVREQIGADKDEPFLKATSDMDIAQWGRAKYRIREEEEGGSSGKKVTLAHAKLLMGYDYKGERSTGDKRTRARPFAAQAAVGNVHLLHAPWNKKFVDELVLFPNAVNDDQVDATSNIFNDLALAPRPQVKPRRLTGF